MKKTKHLFQMVKIGAGAVAASVIIGCVGYVGPDGGVAVGGPDVFVGGVYERGPVVHEYAHRGYASRGWHGGGRGGWHR